VAALALDHVEAADHLLGLRVRAVHHRARRSRAVGLPEADHFGAGPQAEAFVDQHTRVAQRLAVAGVRLLDAPNLCGRELGDFALVVVDHHHELHVSPPDEPALNVWPAELTPRRPLKGAGDFLPSWDRRTEAPAIDI